MVLIQSITFHLNLFDLFFFSLCSALAFSCYMYCCVVFNTFRLISTELHRQKVDFFHSSSLSFDIPIWPMRIHIFLYFYMQMSLQLSVQLLMMVCKVEQRWLRYSSESAQKTIYLTQIKRQGTIGIWLGMQLIRWLVCSVTVWYLIKCDNCSRFPSTIVCFEISQHQLHGNKNQYQWSCCMNHCNSKHFLLKFTYAEKCRRITVYYWEIDKWNLHDLCIGIFYWLLLNGKHSLGSNLLYLNLKLPTQKIKSN